MEMKKKLFSVFNNGSVAWRIFSYSAAVLVFVLAVWTGGAFVYNIVIDNWIRPAFDGRCWGERHISNTVSYQWRYGRRGGTRLCDLLNSPGPGCFRKALPQWKRTEGSCSSTILAGWSLTRGSEWTQTDRVMPSMTATASSGSLKAEKSE